MLTIPLMLKYRGKSFYAAFGGKTGIPVSASSRSEGYFTTRGYFPHLNVTYQNLPDYGFVNNQPFPDNKRDSDVKNAVLMLSVEMGVRWRLGGRASLYSGVYLDYGVTNSASQTSAGHIIVSYQPSTPAQFAYNAYAQQLKPFSCGVMLRLAFGR